MIEATEFAKQPLHAVTPQPKQGFFAEADKLVDRCFSAINTSNARAGELKERLFGAMPPEQGPASSTSADFGEAGSLLMRLAVLAEDCEASNERIGQIASRL